MIDIIKSRQTSNNFILNIYIKINALTISWVGDKYCSFGFIWFSKILFLFKSETVNNMYNKGIENCKLNNCSSIFYNNDLTQNQKKNVIKNSIIMNIKILKNI